MVRTLGGGAQLRHSVEGLNDVVSVQGTDGVIEIGLLLVDSGQGVARVAGVDHVKLLLFPGLLPINIEIIVSNVLAPIVQLRLHCRACYRGCDSSIRQSSHIHGAVELLVLHSVAECLLACHQVGAVC